jgi:hypothetical protein
MKRAQIHHHEVEQNQNQSAARGFKARTTYPIQADNEVPVQMIATDSMNDGNGVVQAYFTHDGTSLRSIHRDITGLFPRRMRAQVGQGYDERQEQKRNKYDLLEWIEEMREDLESEMQPNEIAEFESGKDRLERLLDLGSYNSRDRDHALDHDAAEEDFADDESDIDFTSTSKPRRRRERSRSRSRSRRRNKRKKSRGRRSSLSPKRKVKKKPGKTLPAFHGRNRVSKKSIHDGFRGAATEFTDSYSGRFTAQVQVRGAQDFSLDRDGQLLRHLSTQMYLFAKNTLAQSDEQEVQAMLVNGKVLFASNLEGTMQAITRAFAATKAPNLAMKKALITAYGSSARPQMVPVKVQAILNGERDFDDSEVQDVLHKAVKKTHFLKNVSVEGAGTWMADAKSYPFGFITSGYDGFHAEQKLILALYLSGQKPDVTIRGKKRPCGACHAMLTFAKEKLGLNIAYNPNAGGYFANAKDGLYVLMNLAIKNRDISGTDANAWLKTYLTRFSTHKTAKVAKGGRKKAKNRRVGFLQSTGAERDFDSASDSEHGDSKSD